MQVFKLALAASAATLIAAAPAMAQKSKDTVRLAINDPFVVLSSYHVPVDEAGNFYRRVYQTLVAFDEHNDKVVPQLATSWKRINPTTLEFELRDDVTFHNGNKFDADDVVDTFTYAADPKVQMVYKNRYDWVKVAEKLGPYKVRIESKTPNATDLQMIGYRFSIQDAETHNKLENKADYGRLTPYGTGPFKVVSLDKNQGILVERFDGVKGDPKYVRAPIKRIHGIPMPDRQTQIAQLLTGGIDMIRNVSPDNANEAAKNPELKATTLPTASFVFMQIDAAGRSKNKALRDPRVRKAIWMAIDRDALIKHIVPGNGSAEKMEALCFTLTIACKWSISAPAYDPAGAKKLLAEAGYPNGFDLVYDVFIPIKAIGEAIAGELRKVGIRATVNPVTINVYRKNLSDNETQMASVFYPSAGHPDVSGILDIFFEAERDYARDPIIHKAMTDGLLEFDPAKRAAIYQKAIDRNNEMNYVFAVSSLPTVYAHSKDIEIRPSALSAGDYYIDDYHWK
jgi:peptide/nickel transport system substrate-binding protein